MKKIFTLVLVFVFVLTPVLSSAFVNYEPRSRDEILTEFVVIGSMMSSDEVMVRFYEGPSSQEATRDMWYVGNLRIGKNTPENIYASVINLRRIGSLRKNGQDAPGAENLSKKIIAMVSNVPWLPVTTYLVKYKVFGVNLVSIPWRPEIKTMRAIQINVDQVDMPFLGALLL